MKTTTLKRMSERRGRSMRAISILLASASLAMGAFAPARASEYGNAAALSEAEFRAVTDSVSQTQEWINNAREGLAQAEQQLARLPAGADRTMLERTIRGIRGDLSDYAKQFGRFNTYAGKVTSTLELAHEVADLHALASQREGGPLARQLTYLATGMEKFGEKVPYIGEILAGYGKSANGLLHATDRLARRIDEDRNQGMIGAGTYNQTFAKRYRALVKQFGADFADADTFEPVGPPFLYRPVQDARKVVLLWDEQDGEWYKVENGNKDVETVYREGLLVGKRYTPYQLRTFARNWDDVQSRRNEADKLWEQLNGAAFGNLAFLNVDEASGGELRRVIADRDTFRALFAYDQAGRQKIRDLVGRVKEESRRLDEEVKTARAARDADPARSERPAREGGSQHRDDDRPAQVAMHDSAPAAHAPRPTTGSARVDPDCSKLPSERVERVAGRLASVSRSELVSLSRRVLNEKEQASLLSCLCRTNSSASGSVSVYFERGPVGGSEGCMDPSGGACVNSGFGCWRHQFAVTAEGLDRCGAASRIARSLCERP